MKVAMNMEKATKNTIKFTEVLESELDAPSIGVIYVHKATLKAIGWKEGKTLEVEINAK